LIDLVVTFTFFFIVKIDMYALASFINTSDKYLNPRPPLYIIPNKQVTSKRENSVYRFPNRSRNQGGHRPLGGLSEADPQHKKPIISFGDEDNATHQA